MRDGRDCQIRIRDLALLIVGAGIGAWLVAPRFRGSASRVDDWVVVVAYVLGGVSALGCPLMLWRRIGNGRLRLGEMLWFGLGCGTWMLWPPVVYFRITGASNNQPLTAVCFVYVLPLMGLIATITLAAGGWLRRRRTWRSWREKLGLVLCVFWGLVGTYVLVSLYQPHFSNAQIQNRGLMRSVLAR